MVSIYAWLDLLVGNYPYNFDMCGLFILVFSYIKLMTGSTLNVGPGHNVKYQCILYIKHNRIRVEINICRFIRIKKETERARKILHQSSRYII